MLCQNCGKNEVNFRYTQIINGVKKEMALCDNCAKKLGLESLDFNMSIDLSNFLGNFLTDSNDEELLPNFLKTGTLQCDNCGMTYNEFVNTGKFGCSNCYNVFENSLDSVLKNIHGSSTHIGRKSNVMKNKTIKNSEINKSNKSTIVEKNKQTEEKTKVKGESIANKSTSNKKQITKQEKIEQLNEDLKLAIKEERYEDAAKIRDEIILIRDGS